MSSKPSQPPAESLFALILVVFSVTAFWKSYRISVFSGASTQGLFPMLAAATMTVSALIILVRTGGRRQTGGRSHTGGRDHTADRSSPGLERFFKEVAPRRHLIMLGFMFLYVVAMPLLGFVVSSGLFLFGTFAYLWRKNLGISLILTAGSLGAIFVVFRIVFQVVLPQGTLLQGLF
ncbi:MAG: tripartite tricarboxylate transporter TctB family protein [Alphaproteobacteria bacterium]